MTGPADHFFSIPDYLQQPPTIHDRLLTQTSLVQDETVQECLPLLTAINDPARNPFDFDADGLPVLEKDLHKEFLGDNLSEFPAPFVGIDASRPWLIYWGLLGLSLLGEDVTTYRQRLGHVIAYPAWTNDLPISVFKSFVPLQSPAGGIGGGQGHDAHLAATYAAILSMALVGGEENYRLIDRHTLWQWLGRLKQPDGGFQIVQDGEEDTRAAYCALLAICLLGLSNELPPDSPARQHGFHKFTDGVGDYISRCQTYEGGVAAAPGREAHGAYTFCAVACLCLLDEPHKSLQRYLDVDALVRWLSARQYAPEGGFAGRTNKLVDGCYSQWIGGCYPLVQAGLAMSDSKDANAPLVHDLYSATGLTRYILCCCQQETGGLRDKPSKNADSYHTCYTLVGLSIAANCHYYEPRLNYQPSASAFTWNSVPKTEISVCDVDQEQVCKVMPSIHPVFVVPYAAVAEMKAWVDVNPFQSHL